MKILLIHNYYQRQGGEDKVVEVEKKILELYGHTVVLLKKHNDEISNLFSKIKVAVNAIYNKQAYREVATVIQQFKPDVVHVHNFFPLFSPAVFYACHHTKTPVVLTLHNFRLFCLNACLFREGSICEKCLHTTMPLAGVYHKCYRNSYAGSLSIATMLAFHKLANTWTSKVDAFIAPSLFTKNKFIEGGLPSEKIFVKPNFIFDVSHQQYNGCATPNYVLFVGRLSQEKGIDVLLRAWENMPPYIQLKIVGHGPLVPLVEDACRRFPNIKFLGHKHSSEIYELLNHAKFLVMSSTCFEVFGLVLLEAFAMAKPALVSNIGSPSTIVQHNETGIHFKVGDAFDLVEKAIMMFNDEQLLQRLGENARRYYATHSTPEENYKQLIGIYEKVLCK